MLPSLLRKCSKSSLLSGFAMLAAPVAAPGYALALSIGQQWPAIGSEGGAPATTATRTAHGNRIGTDEHVEKPSIHGWTPLPASG